MTLPASKNDSSHPDLENLKYNQTSEKAVEAYLGNLFDLQLKEILNEADTMNNSKGHSSKSIPEIVYEHRGKSANPLRKIFHPVFIQRDDKNGAIHTSQGRVGEKNQDYVNIQEPEQIVQEEMDYVPIKVYAKIKRPYTSKSMQPWTLDTGIPGSKFVQVPTGNFIPKMLPETKSSNDDLIVSPTNDNFVTLSIEDAMYFEIDVESSCVCTPKNPSAPKSPSKPFMHSKNLSEVEQDYSADSSSSSGRSSAGGEGGSTAQSGSSSNSGSDNGSSSNSESSSAAKSGGMGGMSESKSEAKSESSSGAGSSSKSASKSESGGSGGGSGSSSMASSGSSGGKSYSGSSSMSKSENGGDGGSNSFSFSNSSSNAGSEAKLNDQVERNDAGKGKGSSDMDPIKSENKTPQEIKAGKAEINDSGKGSDSPNVSILNPVKLENKPSQEVNSVKLAANGPGKDTENNNGSSILNPVKHGKELSPEVKDGKAEINEPGKENDNNNGKETLPEVKDGKAEINGSDKGTGSGSDVANPLKHDNQTSLEAEEGRRYLYNKGVHKNNLPQSKNVNGIDNANGKGKKRHPGLTIKNSISATNIGGNITTQTTGKVTDGNVTKYDKNETFTSTMLPKDDQSKENSNSTDNMGSNLPSIKQEGTKEEKHSGHKNKSGMSKDPETGGPIDIYDNLSDGYAISQNANKKDEALINTKENSSNGESSILGNVSKQHHGKGKYTPKPKGFDATSLPGQSLVNTNFDGIDNAVMGNSDMVCVCKKTVVLPMDVLMKYKKSKQKITQPILIKVSSANSGKKPGSPNQGPALAKKNSNPSLKSAADNTKQPNISHKHHPWQPVHWKKINHKETPISSEVKTQGRGLEPGFVSNNLGKSSGTDFGSAELFAKGSGTQTGTGQSSKKSNRTGSNQLSGNGKNSGFVKGKVTWIDTEAGKGKVSGKGYRSGNVFANAKALGTGIGKRPGFGQGFTEEESDEEYGLNSYMPRFGNHNRVGQKFADSRRDDPERRLPYHNLRTQRDYVLFDYLLNRNNTG